MQEPCVFYKTKLTTLKGTTAASAPTTQQPQVFRKGYCAHPKSKHPRNAAGPSVPCGGDLEKCVIPAEEWRSP